MTKKKRNRNRVFKISKKELNLPKCGVCKQERKCNMYPCEIEYRSNEDVKCENTMPICDECFTVDKVFVCKDHEKDVNVIYCNFTGKLQIDSPVYFDYPHLGIRRVKDYTCENCKKKYQVCNYHEEIVYKKCYNCLSSFTL